MSEISERMKATVDNLAYWVTRFDKAPDAITDEGFRCADGIETAREALLASIAALEVQLAAANARAGEGSDR